MHARLLFFACLTLVACTYEEVRTEPATQSPPPSTTPSPGTETGTSTGGEERICGTRGAAPCAAEEFCDFPEAAQCGAADAPGVCRPRPQICTREYSPVCGCDGNTYATACTANAAGTAVATRGECASSPQ